MASLACAADEVHGLAHHRQEVEVGVVLELHGPVPLEGYVSALLRVVPQQLRLRGLGAGDVQDVRDPGALRDLCLVPGVPVAAQEQVGQYLRGVVAPMRTELPQRDELLAARAFLLLERGALVNRTEVDAVDVKGLVVVLQLLCLLEALRELANGAEGLELPARGNEFAISSCFLGLHCHSARERLNLAGDPVEALADTAFRAEVGAPVGQLQHERAGGAVRHDELLVDLVPRPLRGLGRVEDAGEHHDGAVLEAVAVAEHGDTAVVAGGLQIWRRQLYPLSVGRLAAFVKAQPARRSMNGPDVKRRAVDDTAFEGRLALGAVGDLVAGRQAVRLHAYGIRARLGDEDVPSLPRVTYQRVRRRPVPQNEPYHWNVILPAQL
mmetsp:Transcript_34456/g.94849  ORF Transcript_34456/g.94849 Transcript_34456/m.94849 type:complete len:381 (+) Transcript_34456:365-1507(+)